MAKGDEVEVLPVAGRDVRITNPGKVMFPQRGKTKLDLARYYLAVADGFLTATQGRPLLLKRFPDGATGNSFFQKRVAPTKADPWLTTTKTSTPNGTTSDALVAVDMANVLWAVNMGCLGFEVWPTTAATPEHTDELRIDLDPGPGVSFEMIREGRGDQGAVRRPRRRLPAEDHRQPRHPHLRPPAARVGQLRRAPGRRPVARELERRRPDLLTAAWWKEERGSRVFIDFNQNAPHKTVFGAWCVRANPHGQVSSPFRWDELEAIDRRSSRRHCPPASPPPATRGRTCTTTASR